MSDQNDFDTLVVCIDDTGYEASLEIGKVYGAFYELELARQNQIRVVDESGDSYVYPVSYFRAFL